MQNKNINNNYKFQNNKIENRKKTDNKAFFDENLKKNTNKIVSRTNKGKKSEQDLLLQYDCEWLISIKTLTGQDLPIKLPLSTLKEWNWFDLKAHLETIQHIPADQQRIVQWGKLMEDSNNILRDYAEITDCKYGNQIKLMQVLRLLPEVSFDTHNFFILAQNFYDLKLDNNSYDWRKGRLNSFYSAFQLTPNMSEEERQNIFEIIYQNRLDRIEKNKGHHDKGKYQKSPKAIAIIAIMAVSKDVKFIHPTTEDGKPIINPDGTKDFFLKTYVDGIENQEDFSYELFSYMSPEGKQNAPYSRLDNNVAALNQQFRLFCSRKIASNQYGEVSAYLEMTKEYYLSEETDENKITILNGIEKILRGEALNPDEPLYENIREFDIFKARFNCFQGKEPNDEEKNMLKIILTKFLEENRNKSINIVIPNKVDNSKEIKISENNFFEIGKRTHVDENLKRKCLKDLPWRVFKEDDEFKSYVTDRCRGHESYPNPESIHKNKIYYLTTEDYWNMLPEKNCDGKPKIGDGKGQEYWIEEFKRVYQRSPDMTYGYKFKMIN